MSFPAVLAALGIKDDRLELGEKFLLVVIGSYAGPELTCFPSQKTLAEHMNATDRSVRAYLAKLEALGYITRQKRRANGKQTSDLLTLQIQPETLSARPSFQAETNVVSGGNKRHSQAETISYEPVIESRINKEREAVLSQEPAPRSFDGKAAMAGLLEQLRSRRAS